MGRRLGRYRSAEKPHEGNSAALLASRFRVLKSEGNLNNEYGLPLQLLRLEEADEAAVVELGCPRGGTEAFGANCAPGRGRGHARRAGAPGIFRIGGRNALAKRELIEGSWGARVSPY